MKSHGKLSNISRKQGNVSLSIFLRAEFLKSCQENLERCTAELCATTFLNEIIEVCPLG